MTSYNSPFQIENTDTAIDLRQVVKKFSNAAGEFIVLKGLNLAIQKGEFVSIVGKSGSGKSTLLNMITGIDRPTTGDVIVGGVHLHQLSESQRALWRGKTIGIVFQFFQLFPTLSLLENVTLPMDYCNIFAPGERVERAKELLSRVGLESNLHKLPAALSTGQQQSAAIARALANDPPIIVADEPTGNLDSQSAASIIQLFASLVEQGKTILMVTHDPTLTERTERTIAITDGELIDETVIKALPLLNHRQMMTITRQLQRLSFAPGQSIIGHNEHLNLFYMIASGNVEIVLQDGNNTGMVVAKLEPGEFFGEIELISGNRSIAAVRAASHTPVEIVALRHEDFMKLLESSPLTEKAICKLVEMRIEEHQVHGGGRR